MRRVTIAFPGQMFRSLTLFLSLPSRADASTQLPWLASRPEHQGRVIEFAWLLR